MLVDLAYYEKTKKDRNRVRRFVHLNDVNTLSLLPSRMFKFRYLGSVIMILNNFTVEEAEPPDSRHIKISLFTFVVRR